MKEHERLRAKLEELSNGDLEKNEQVFQETVLAYIKACNEDKEVKEYNFSNLTFPKILFEGVLEKSADFREATFSGDADFGEATFSGDVSFGEATFSGDASFGEATFSGYADFISATFSGSAFFNWATFSDSAFFGEATFSGSAFFIEATFSGSAFFNSTTFEERAYFDRVLFHEEVIFSYTRFAFLKLPPGSAGIDEDKPVSLECAVLEAAHLWGIDELRHYSFKNAFLIGVSLAGKSLVNCDLTGAVMNNVHTKDWKLDQATIENTKFIYTDYRKEEQEEEGNLREVYVAVEESRVPADGEFGGEVNENFTLKEYFHEPHKWNYALGLRPELRDTILNVVQFFKYYAEKAKAEHVDIDTRTEGGKVRIVFQVEESEDRARVEGLFQDYIDKIFSLEGFVVEFENSELSEADKADVQRRAEYHQRSALIEYGTQLQLNPQMASEINESTVLPLLKRERKEAEAFAIELVKAMSQAGPKQLNLTNTTSVTLNVNKSAVGLKMGELVNLLDGATNEIGERRVKQFQTELEEIVKDVKADKTSEAKSRWEATWNSLREITDFASKFPKLYELGDIIQALF